MAAFSARRLGLMAWAAAGEGFLRSVLKRYILGQFPELSPQELDFMLGVALQDLLNYVAYRGGYIYDADYRERAVEQLSELAERDPLQFDSLLTELIEVWGIKWRQRVKLILAGNQESSRESETVEKAVGRLIPLLGELYPWLLRFAVGSLIANGEVCFTNLVAETIVKESLFKLATSMQPEEAAKFVERNPAFILGEIVRRARGTAQYKGNLVVVRVNPSFFEESGGEAIEW